MVEIKPFKGIRYNKEKIKDFSLVITPPYDVINEKEQEEFYNLSEYNTIRLILGEEKDDKDKYTRAAKYFKEWQEKGILKKDDKDSIYIYSQKFRYNENEFTRIGFVSLVKLEQLGKSILPHEKTLEKPFKDRLALINATKANFGFVFILYDDRGRVIDSFIKDKILLNSKNSKGFENQRFSKPRKTKFSAGFEKSKIHQKSKISECTKKFAKQISGVPEKQSFSKDAQKSKAFPTFQNNNKKPDMDFEDKSGIKHKLWKIADEEFINKLKEEMLQYRCIIADGHHTYKSVLKFSEEHPELEDAKYTMCCFINSFNEGLFILPIDRFVFNLENVDIDKILSQLKEYFALEEVESVDKLIKKVDNTPIMIDKTINLKNHVFGMYCYLNKKSYFLKLKNNNILDEYYPDDTDVYKKLDINILHKIVFENILGISEEDQFKGTHIEYTKGSKRALDKLKDDKYQFAFFLNPPLMREIFLTARANETMPQKSTYFYPKVYSGLVINKIDK